MSHLKLVTKQKEDIVTNHDKFILLDFEELLHNNKEAIEAYCIEELVKDFKASTPVLSQREIKSTNVVSIIPHSVTEFAGLLIYVKIKLVLEG